MTTAWITGIDLGGPRFEDDSSWGYFVDDNRRVRKVRLTYGEAQAIIAELKTEEGVLYDIGGDDETVTVPGTDGLMRLGTINRPE